MTPEEFVSQTRRSILEENMQIYRELFATDESSRVSDLYWQNTLNLLRRLNEADRDVLLGVVRQTIVDTLSTVFAILDGVAWLPGQKDDFVLRYGEDSAPLNGELQDLFLAAEEESDQPE